MSRLRYLHVDVFSPTPYCGNGLPVFFDAPELTQEAMLRITQELRHFEAVFVQPDLSARRARVRVFDLFEELPFAGHPLIGAAAVLQHHHDPLVDGRWMLELSGRREVCVDVTAHDDHYRAILDQGEPAFLGAVNPRQDVARAFALEEHQLMAGLPLEVASTGLAYLVVPVVPGAMREARIHRDISEMLRAFGAQFAVLFDPAAREIRHWNNDGVVEDIATGSAAGVVAAYAVRHGVEPPGHGFSLSQGRFVGRPSRLDVNVELSGETIRSVRVGGAVSIVGEGRLLAAPAANP